MYTIYVYYIYIYIQSYVDSVIAHHYLVASFGFPDQLGASPGSVQGPSDGHVHYMYILPTNSNSNSLISRYVMEGPKDTHQPYIHIPRCIYIYMYTYTYMCIYAWHTLCEDPIALPSLLCF
jgi:hypothetical protein